MEVAVISPTLEGKLLRGAYSEATGPPENQVHIYGARSKPFFATQGKERESLISSEVQKVMRSTFFFSMFMYRKEGLIPYRQLHSLLFLLM